MHSSYIVFKSAHSLSKLIIVTSIISLRLFPNSLFLIFEIVQLINLQSSANCNSAEYTYPPLDITG